MPLVRLQVRNEFGLGQPELYSETNREDPKAILDGVAVAGLVGILRQLGDLADFAAEVFHGLQEQVMTVASRSHKLMVRVQNIEASLPPLEKAILAQTSHIHFAYTAGCEWHPRIKAARNHFIYDDLPQFVMDSYEECREPPRVHLLDKFDTGGAGACLRRYTDPTFFNRVSAISDESYFEKTEKARKSRKKKRSSRRNGELLRGEQRHSSSGRMQFISPTAKGRTSSQMASTVDIRVKSDLEDHSKSFDSRADTGYIECVFHPSNPMQSGEQDCKEPSSSRLTQKIDTRQSVSPHADDSISHDYLEKQIASSSSGVTWDEKEEIVEFGSEAYDREKKSPERIVQKQDRDIHPNEAVTITNSDFNDIIFDEQSSLKPVSRMVQTDDIDSEPDNYMDALNTIESEYENNLDYERKREVELCTSHVTHGIMENAVLEATSNVSDSNLSDVYQTGNTVSLNKETACVFPEPLSENLLLISQQHLSNLGSVSQSDVPTSEEMTNDTVSLTKETLRDSSDTLYEIPPLASDSHAMNLGSESPSDVTASEETIGDTLSLNNETVRDLPVAVQKIPPASLQPHSDDLVSPSSDVLVSKETEKDLAGSHSLKSPICEQVAHARGNSVLDCTVCTDSFNHDAYTVNGTVSPAVKTDISFSGSKTSNLPGEEENNINSNICKSEGTPSVSSGDHSVSFWTNGGLLGLEPSKPPDFTMHSSSQGPSNAKSEMDGHSSRNPMQKGTVLKCVCDLSEEVAEQIPKEPSSRCLTEDDQACIPAKTYGSPQLSNGFSQTDRKFLGEIRVIAPESVLPASPESKPGPERPQGNAENSSLVFGISHRLLLNNFQQRVSFDEKSGPYNSHKSGVLEQSGQNGIVQKALPEVTFKEQVASGYPLDSLPPSPPLEHMKISFHPVSGLDTSKLKLKFPDGNTHHESIRDMFPSFQLVPEPSLPLNDSGFHSDDDDTFCRSSPSLSDDCLSPRCNSDQWESDEAPDSSDHGIYDSPHRRSSSESMSRTKELGGISKDDSNVAFGHGTYTPNGVEPSLSGSLLDFPSFDNVKPVIEQGSNKHSECNDVAGLHSHAEPMLRVPPPPPPPPPLPSIQWQASKPQLNMTNGTQHCMSEDAEHIRDLSLPEATFFQQPRLTEVEQTQINHNGHKSPDSIFHKSEEKLDWQKLNDQKEANQLRMGKETDERDYFLQQIRTKSFNLRPAVKEKPNTTAGNNTNVKVTAILEKAIAIRQVVASDDGEDDENWSDT